MVAISYILVRNMQYIYQDGDGYVFLDADNDEQWTVSGPEIGAQMGYVKEGYTAAAVCRDGQPVALNLPPQVELEVVEADFGDEGSPGMATLETGLRVRVPPGIEVGDVLRVDTRTGSYLGLTALRRDIKERIG